LLLGADSYGSCGSRKTVGFAARACAGALLLGADSYGSCGSRKTVGFAARACAGALLVIVGE
jgi:hypothetical protein